MKPAEIYCEDTDFFADLILIECPPRRRSRSQVIAEIAVYSFGAMCLVGAGWLALNLV